MAPLFRGDDQEICVSSAGFISCLSWIKADDQNKFAFVFGALDGNIHLYKQGADGPLFNFTSITIAHPGAIKSLTWDLIHRQLATVGDCHVQVWKFGSNAKTFVSLMKSDKQPYVARAIQFCDDGSSILVLYLESGLVFCYSLDPYDLKWQKGVNGRIGNTFLDSQNFFVSNLHDGVDKYLLPALHHTQSYLYAIVVNVPVQISVACEAGWVVVGGDNGFA
ncbi:hypothetical protein BDN67DRAFT_1016119 [Paxillus ammoniavirescens]|nr:hypothetical protein BDN67DRAFT_1016119 [Paxillus ammoniavirescens]